MTVLCCYFFDNALLDREVEEDWFFPPEGSDWHLFRAMKAMRSKGHPVEYMSLLGYLSDKGLMGKAGGHAYVAEVFGLFTGGENMFGYYAESLRRKRCQRIAIMAGMEIAEAGYHPEMDEMESRVSAQMVKVKEAIHYKRNEKTWAQEVDEFEKDWGQRYLKKKRSAIPTRWAEWNKHFGGLRPEFHVLKGKTSRGKTSLALNLLSTVAVIHQKPCLWFPYEMSRKSLIARLMCDIAEVDSRCLFTPDVFPPSREEGARLKEAKKRIAEAPIEIVKERNMDAGFIVNRCLSFASKHGEVGLIGIDYLQKIAHPEWSGRNDNSSDRISYNCGQCFNVQQEIGCPMLMISSTNQDGGTLGSQSADYDCDVALEIDKDHGFKNPKNRNGPTSKEWIELRWNGAHVRFESMIEEGSPP